MQDGHDGTWVAHPGLIPLAREIFDAHMPGPNQLHRLREDVAVTAEDLLAVSRGGGGGRVLNECWAFGGERGVGIRG